MRRERALLGLLIGRVAGVPYRRYVSEALLMPLGMRDAAWDAAQVPAGSLATPHVRAGDEVTPIAPWRLGASEAAAGLYASLADMGRFIGFQLAAWPTRDASDPRITSLHVEEQTGSSALENAPRHVKPAHCR